MKWVHQYNTHGPEALMFRRSGGRPLFCKEIDDAIDKELRKAIADIALPPVTTVPTETPTQSTPIQPLPESPESSAFPTPLSRPAPTTLPTPQPLPPRWTLKRLVAWVQEHFGIQFCRETLRKVLKRLGFSWKKAKKLLARANPKKRQEFLDKLKTLLDGAMNDEFLLVYLDEAHIHQDVDLGYGWSLFGERFWVSSDSPGLAAKVSFYGLYLYNEGQVRVWSYECGNGENTVDVLRRLRQEFPDRPIKLVWDGASYHRSILVRQAATDLKIDLEPLPGYSPDFMPVEALWRWLREDVTYQYCHKTKQELIERVTDFQDRINQNIYEIADRLWVKDTLDPEVEKLRISK